MAPALNKPAPCPACEGEGFRSFPSDICQTQVDAWPADIRVTCDCCEGSGISPLDGFDADDSGAQPHVVEPVADPYGALCDELAKLFAAPWPCVPAYA